MKMPLREALCRLLGHRPEDTGRPSGLLSCARCFDVLPGERERIMSVTIPNEPITSDGVTYTAWTDGYAVGFKATHEDGRVEYVYLNPSGESDDGVPTVFLYQGPWGAAHEDDPLTHTEIRFDREVP